MKDYKKLFEELKAEIKAAGIYERATTRGIIEMALIVASLTLAFTTSTYWNPILLGLFFTVIFTRAVFLSHDLLHRQIFKSKTISKRMTLPFSNLLLGMSASWWDWKHNVNHHTYTNCTTKDPDITALNGIFMDQQGNNRLVARFPHLIFWTALMFMYPAFVAQSLKYMMVNRKYDELLLFALHIPLFYGSLFYLLPTMDALIVFFTLYVTLGVWLSLGFITNHLGCPVVSEEEYQKLSWLELQVSTSRNLKSNIFVHWFFGGLDTQIEHHLYPKAPRFNLLKAVKITQDFCKKHDIYYHETSVIAAFVEIDRTIKQNSRK